MSLFDDDFYSPKIPRKIKKLWGPKRVIFRRGVRMSTLQIAVVSSVSSAVVAILLFSWITGAGTGSSESAQVVHGKNPEQAVEASDPYERIITASAKVSPWVVSIVNKQKNAGSSVTVDAGLGSGIIVKKENGDALVLTNNHVIKEADELEVVLSNGTRKSAKVVGKDPTTDIAVLKVDDEGIDQVAELGDSTKLRRGETVLAIGNALGLGESLSFGIVSKTLQVVPISLNGDGVYDWEQEVIQTDAAINEGNSGGALVNLKGQVIGVNAMKVADVGVEGIGFAIPINNAMDIAEQIIQNGHVIRPYLGVYTVDINNPYAPLDEQQLKSLKLPASVKDGVLVLEASGPSAKGGLELNDVIVKLDATEIKTTLALRKYLYNSKKVDDSIEVTYYRQGKLLTAMLTLTDRPKD